MSMGGGGEQTQESNTVADTLVQNYTPQTAGIAGQYQVQAANQAAQLAAVQTQTAIDQMRSNYADAFRNVKPYTQTGIQALNELNQYLGLDAYNPGNAPTVNITPAQVRSNILQNTYSSRNFGDPTRLGSQYQYVGKQAPDIARKEGIPEAPSIIGYDATEADPNNQPGNGLWRLLNDPNINAAEKEDLTQQALQDPLFLEQQDMYNYAKDQYNKYTAQGKLTPQQVIDKLSNTPGYQFQLNQGLDAVQRAASAQGTLGSGRMLQELANYGQGLAQQTYGSHLDRLASLVGMGQQSATGQSNQAAQLGQTTAGLQQQLGDTYANAELAKGQAQSSSYLAGHPNYQIIPLTSKTTSKTSGGGGGGLGGLGQLVGMGSQLMGMFG